jgi:hypothetical protein
MSTINRTPLDGFEDRLLTQLKAQVASRPRSAPQPSPTGVAISGRRTHRRRTGSLLTAVAAAMAAVLVVLNVLPDSQLSLAQAFPILAGRSQPLSGLVKRILRSQRLTAGDSTFADERAYAFKTPVGTGYVVVNQGTNLLCIVVPDLGTDSGSVRCETAVRLLARDSAGIGVVTKPQGGRDEVIVELLRRGAATRVIGTQGVRRHVALRSGILTIVTRGPVTVATTIDGRQSSATYGAAGRSTARLARSVSPVLPRRRSVNCVPTAATKTAACSPS